MRVPSIVVSLTCLIGAAGCARPVRVATVDVSSQRCRAVESAPQALRWTAPADDKQRTRLDRWCAAVGPPLLRSSPTPDAGIDGVTIVAWNVHVGQADIHRLIGDLRASGTKAQTRAIVLLLQEAKRTGGDVPRRAPRGARMAARIGPATGEARPFDIQTVARELDWSLVYVPSMRNGEPPVEATAADDRGAAILSSIPLTAPHAIELPVERQRRVAITARLAHRTSAGLPWSLDVVSVHLENRPGPGRGWFRAAAARTRQVEALLSALASAKTAGTGVVDDVPVVMGGDLNTWRGSREGALRLLRRAFPRGGSDVRPTFRRFRLDYLLGRLPDSVSITQRRLDDAYGSDHYPVVAEIDFGRQ
ncbi:MAG TPA: endonuclease/exonuclease/phosphatase family protein [Luteitalea sp.]|nr:endonuclease/exonuclease/phosphatase family protein [Luteitalea sp.]